MARSSLVLLFGCLLASTMTLVPVAAMAAEGDAPASVLITKEWKIPRDLIPGVPPESTKTPIGIERPDKRIADRETPKKWLIENGVAFENTASAVYIVRSSRLIVRNTQVQLDLIDAIVRSRLKSEDLLVEIECHFVEISWDRLKDLKFESLLGHFNSPATKNAFISGSKVGVAASGPEGPNWPFDAGQLSGVVTDPQYQLVLRMLLQKMGADLVSSPKVTLTSGQSARIEMVREFASPPAESPEDTPPQVVRQSDPVSRPGNVSPAAETSPAAPSLVKVVVDIKPTVGIDGYTWTWIVSPKFWNSKGWRRAPGVGCFSALDSRRV